METPNSKVTMSGDELLKLNRERLIKMILFAANFDCFLVVNAAFNAAEANFANIARHNAQKENANVAAPNRVGIINKVRLIVCRSMKDRLRRRLKKTVDYQLVEVGLLGIRGSFFPRPFGGSFQFRSYLIFIGEAADHNLQVDGVNFEFSDDQRLLRHQDRRFLDDNASLRIARAILDDEALAYDADLWLSIAELGGQGQSYPRNMACRPDPRRPSRD